MFLSIHNINSLYEIITEQREKGKTFDQIAEWLNKKGYLSFRGKKFKGNQVDWVVITGSNDSTSNNTTNDDDDMPEIFKQRAG